MLIRANLAESNTETKGLFMATNTALAHVQGISSCGNRITFDLKVTVFEHDLPKRPELNDVIEITYDATSVNPITTAPKEQSADCLSYIAQYIASRKQGNTR